MSLFFQYVASGLATGCTFALTATGFVAVYRVTRVVNFAQGMFAVVGGMITYSLLALGLPHGLSEAVAVLVGALVGAVVGVVAIGKPGTPTVASLIITLGLAIGTYAIIILVWGDQPLSFAGLGGNLKLGPVSLQYQYVLVVVVTALTFVALAAFFDHTYLGKALTACSSNPYAARLMGIDVTRMGLISFALGGALGALAGVLLAPLQPVSFNSDVGLAINGFAAAVFGGILRPLTALLGGLVLGVAEALVAGFSRASLETGVALVLLLGLMVWQTSRRAAGAIEEAAV